MFKRLAVAFDESREAERALTTAISLAKGLDAKLWTVTVVEELPAYTSYTLNSTPLLHQTLSADRVRFYDELQEKAAKQGADNGLPVETHLVDGREVEAIIEFIKQHNIDLLVIGIHQPNLYVARLWSTVYKLELNAPCSVLGVH